MAKKIYHHKNARISGHTLEASAIYTSTAALDVESESVSDGYHTMDELYEHRNLLFVVTLCGIQWYNNCNVGPFQYQIWKSKFHEDGSMYEGWFIAGAYIPGNTESEISYHLPLELWDILKCPERAHAPEFTGYTSKDVLERIRKYYL